MKGDPIPNPKAPGCRGTMLAVLAGDPAKNPFNWGCTPCLVAAAVLVVLAVRRR